MAMFRATKAPSSASAATARGRVTPGQVLRAAAAPFLILAAPYAAYLQFHRYALLQPESLLILALFAGVALVFGAVASRSYLAQTAVLAALLTFFADIQAPDLGLKVLGLVFLGIAAVLWVVRRHASPLVAAGMAAMCVVALVPQSPAAGHPSTPPGNPDLPLVLHVVLDEHLGLAGLPPDLTPATVRGEYERFFPGRGFRLFGAAYSEFPETKWSLPHLFNLSTGEYRDDLTQPGAAETSYRMTRNEYFARMKQAGYAIRVYQPDYLDVCAGVVAEAACETYRARTVEGVQRIDAPSPAKVRVIGGSYLYRSEVYRRVRGAYREVRVQLPPEWRPPSWNWERGSTAPIGSRPMFDVVAADLASAGRGDMVFAHFLLPHYPYVFNARCQPRPIGDWLERSSDARVDLAKGAINTSESRAARYRLYFEQLACTRTRLARLLDAIPPALRADAIVLVHGDHGSRISLTDPVTTVEHRMQPSDYADNYSTLFAVRAPGIARGYDPQPLAISCLLMALVESGFRSADTAASCAPEARVFFRQGSAPRLRPLRAFWAPPSPPATRAATQIATAATGR